MFDEWRSGTSRTWSRIWRHYPHCPWEKPWVFWQGDFGWMGKKSNEGGVCFLLFLMGLMDVVVFFVFVFWGEGGCTYQIQRNQDGRSDLERQRTRTEVLKRMLSLRSLGIFFRINLQGCSPLHLRQEGSLLRMSCSLKRGNAVTKLLAGAFKYFYEMTQFDGHIFQTGWNPLVCICNPVNWHSHGKSFFFPRQYHQIGWFSMAMLIYYRVPCFPCWMIRRPATCPWEMFFCKELVLSTIVSQSSPTKDLTNPSVFLMPTLRVFIYLYMDIYCYQYVFIFYHIYIVIKVVYVRFTATQQQPPPGFLHF